MKRMILYLGIVVAGVVVYLVLSANATTIPRPRIKSKSRGVYHDPMTKPTVELFLFSDRECSMVLYGD